MQFSICNHIYIIWLNHYSTLKVRSVGGVEKWEDEKLVEEWKSGRIENI